MKLSGRARRSVVTACLHHHFDIFAAFLEFFAKNNSSQITLVFYDLGIQNISIQWIHHHYPFVIVRKFDYTKFPDFFDVDIARGESLGVKNSNTREAIRNRTVQKTLSMLDMILKFFFIALNSKTDWTLQNLPTEIVNKNKERFNLHLQPPRM